MSEFFLEFHNASLFENYEMIAQWNKMCKEK